MKSKEEKIKDIFFEKRTSEDFEKHYNVIQNKLKFYKTSNFFLRKFIIITVSVIFIAAAIMIPLFLSGQTAEPRYFTSDLVWKLSDEKEFYTNMDKLNIKVPEIPKDYIQQYKLYLPQESETVVGGILELEMENDNNYCQAIIRLYSKQIEIDTQRYSSFNDILEGKNITFYYKLIEYDEVFYNYICYGIHEQYTIVLEYLDLTNNFVDFLQMYFR